MKESGRNLTSGRLLAGNTLWNLSGQLLPMVVGVACVPPLVRGLGDTRFGLLSLAWIVVGYFSLFDLGLGRALTKFVSDKLGAGEENSVPPLVWTSLLLMLVLGIVGGGIMSALAPWLVSKTHRIPAVLQPEALTSFYLLALCVPLVTLTAGLRGALEAQQRFAILNLIRIPMSVFLFAAPLLALPFSYSLVPVIAILLAGRLIGCVVHAIACFRAIPGLWSGYALQQSLVPSLLRMGGWMTVSNVVGPAVLYVDRFLIGALLSMSAVTYYTVPFDAVSRLIVIPVSIVGVLFPAFAVSMLQKPDRAALLLDRGLKYVFLIIFPAVLLIMTLASEILRIWLGAAFAENSSSVLRWLAAGIFLNCLSTVPFSFLQAIGRADLTGKVLLIDLLLSMAGVSLFIKYLGIEGAAIAWTVRATIETLVFMALSWRFFPRKSLPWRRWGVGIVFSGFVFYLATLPVSLAAKGLFLICSLVSFAFVGWVHVFTAQERSFLRERLLSATAESKLFVSISKGDV